VTCKSEPREVEPREVHACQALVGEQVCLDVLARVARAMLHGLAWREREHVEVELTCERMPAFCVSGLVELARAQVVEDRAEVRAAPVDEDVALVIDGRVDPLAPAE